VFSHWLRTTDVDHGNAIYTLFQFPSYWLDGDWLIDSSIRVRGWFPPPPLFHSLIACDLWQYAHIYIFQVLVLLTGWRIFILFNRV